MKGRGRSTGNEVAAKGITREGWSHTTHVTHLPASFIFFFFLLDLHCLFLHPLCSNMIPLKASKEYSWKMKEKSPQRKHFFLLFHNYIVTQIAHLICGWDDLGKSCCRKHKKDITKLSYKHFACKNPNRYYLPITCGT